MRLLLLSMLIIFSSTVNALPSLDVSLAPTELWLGDSLGIEATCTDSMVNNVYADIEGPGISIPSLDYLTVNNNTYTFTIPGSYFDRTGTYTAVVFCEGNGTVNASESFAVSELTGELAIVSDSYSGGMLEIHVSPKKNNVILVSDVSFSVEIDGTPQEFSIPPVYDSSKGWVLRLESPSPGTHILSAEVSFQDKTLVLSEEIKTKPPIEFEIVSFTNSVQPGENITIALKALDRGSAIELDENDLLIRIDSTTADILGIIKRTNEVEVKIEAPDLSPGEHIIEAEMVYNSITYSSSREMNYITVISGKLLDAEGKAVNAQFRFFQEGSEKLKLNTLSDGSFSGEIVPGTYDVDMEFTRARIKLEDAKIDEFEDAIKYLYKPSTEVEGFVMSGVYIINILWNFDEADVTLSYEDIFDDESLLRVFKCSNWNSAKNECNAKWAKLIPTVDADSNIVKFTTGSFSTFIVGFEDEAELSLKFDKEKYAKKDLVKITGSTSGKQGMISEVDVRLKLDGVGVAALTSNANGIFSAEFIAPEKEGNYTLTATATKSPYGTYNKTYTIEVISVPSTSIIFPSTIKIVKGKNITEDIKIVNTGQSLLTDVQLSLDMDDRYYSIPAHESSIETGEEMHVPVTFFSYSNDELTTLSAAVIFKSNEIEKEKIFGFTIMENTAIETTGSVTSGPMFQFDFASVNTNIVYLIIFAIAAFSVAFLMKKRKMRSWQASYGQPYTQMTYQQCQAPLPAAQAPRSNRVHHALHHRHIKNYPGHSSLYLSEIKNYLSTRKKQAEKSDNKKSEKK